ncbi:hypothetical protein [Nereida ignava]|uniref:hypothetical protein n=1 Tax=Nereida ignava TaxID=282199 RepID=UPI0030F4E3EB
MGRPLCTVICRNANGHEPNVISDNGAIAVAVVEAAKTIHRGELRAETHASVPQMVNI